MPEMRVPFSAVLEVLESYGWHLMGIYKPYRVFRKAGEPLPILVEVDEEGTVHGEVFKKIVKEIE